MSLRFRVPTLVGLMGTAAFVLAAAAGEVRAQPGAGDDERESPEVNKLVFHGVRAVDEGELRESIATQESTCRGLLYRPFCLFSDSRFFVEKHYLDRTEFRRDVLRIRVFYWRRGYREAEVDTAVTRDGDGVRVTFTVREGPPTLVGSVTVEGVSDVLSRREALSLPLRAGAPLHLIRLDSSRALLQERLWEKGYADAVITDTAIVPPGQRVGSAVISIDPKWRATVASIRVRGNDQVSERTILNSMVLKTGRIYRRSDLITSQRNLYQSNMFRQAVIIVPPQGDSTKLIEVTVQEAPLNEARTSVGFNTVDYFQTEGRYTRYNFLGGGRRLDVRGVLGNLLAEQLNGRLIFMQQTDDERYLRPNWQTTVDFVQPWFRSPRNTLAGGVFAHRRSAPAIFIDHGLGATATFTRELATRHTASVTYRFELTQVEASEIYFCQNYGVCEVGAIGALRETHRLSPIAISSVADRTNEVFFPTSGYVARLDAEHASGFTSSDWRHNRLSAEASKYFGMGRRRAIAVHVRGGMVRPLRGAVSALGVQDFLVNGTEIIHPRKRFYAGGSQSVRGYAENQLGPRILTIDPRRLTDTTLAEPCDGAQLASGTCDPNLAGLPSSAFQPRPLGGRALLEGNVEYRFPVWKELGAAAFVDAALVGDGGLGDLSRGTGAITPGMGVRYYSPAGAIRIDLGFRPSLVERLPVATEVIENGERRLVTLSTKRRYDPVEGGGFREVLNRLQLHLSIGQAF